MEPDNLRKKVLYEVILGYREVIKERYQYETLRKKYELPASFDKARVDLLRDYFLNQIYPHPERRKELDEAFASLDNYIGQPAKLLRILIDSSRLIFKYGRHLPKILSAGIKALKSFRKAVKFENSLVRSAMANEIKAPYDKEKIFALIKSLPRAEIEAFIESGESLFETLHDRELVAKIEEIVEYLIKMMLKRPNTYSVAEIKGLQIGYEVIRDGNQLFDRLNKADQQRIFTVITQIEREILDQIFSTK